MSPDLCPLPAIYCPPGIARPAHCPHDDAIGLRDGAGPDGQAGTVWAPRYDPDTEWRRTPGGWYIEIADHHAPQLLQRLHPHPQILRFRTICGARAEHRWRVPVLLAPIRNERGEIDTFVSATDRIWRGGDTWEPDAEILSAQRSLLAVALGVPLADTAAERNDCLLGLACSLLALTHAIDPWGHELAARGWISDRLIADIICAASGLDGADAEPLP